MPIRVERNESGNCVNFHGSSNPTYWNACLTAYVDDNVADTINVVNDIITAQTGVTEYEFFQIPYTEFTKANNDAFATAQEAADYITAAARVIGISPESSGNDLTDVTVCFKLDDTSTSIILDNGYSFGVNTIKAIAEGGVIEIHSISGDRTLFSNLAHTNACINDLPVPGGLNDVVNALNELFTVGAFTSVVISDPYATMVADVDGTVDLGSLVGSAVVDPAGNDIGGNTQTHNNNAGYLSTETIDQAGEYFTFDIRGEGQIGFGLVHTQASYDEGYYSGNATYANPATFCNGANSSHYGFQFAHFFHPTPNGSWTNYGANTAYSMQPGWSNWESQNEWLAGDPVKIKVGLDENGYISISSLQDDDATWVVHSRTTYPAAQGAEFKLGIKFSNPSARLYSQPKVHLLEPAAPTMYFRYIESPDGVFQYPLFATAEEANYYDTENGGSGTSHQHVYADDPTNTTWYMPDTNSTMTGIAAPLFDLSLGQSAAYTEITSQTNADLAPAAFTDATLTVDELAAINYQTQPQDTAYTTTFTGLPFGLFAFAGTISGNAPEVTGYNDVNPSDTYTVTVTRTNSYGSSTGTLTIIVNNLTAPPVTAITGFTHESASTALVDSDTMDEGSVVRITETIGDGERLVIDKEWFDNNVMPAINTGTGSKRVRVGFGKPAADWSSIEAPDFWVHYSFYADDTSRGANNWRLQPYTQSTQQTNVGIGSLTSALYDYVFINDGGDVTIGALVASQGHNASTYVYDSTDSNWNWDYTQSTGTTGAKSVYIAVEDVQIDISTTGIAEYTEPSATTSLTNWTKALDFSGSSERAAQVTQDSNRIPMKMYGQASLITGTPTSGYTSSNTSAKPWATACVFKIDGNSSNQHIWNLGEGAGDNDDNIYLRVDAAQNLYFGWGRNGALNECRIATAISSAFWYAVYIGHDGRRWASAGATAGNLYQTFDIRMMSSHDNFASSWDAGTYTNWNQASSTTGGRMDRGFTGEMTIGGRGANRNFHGKVASFVTTTLRRGVAMPDATEIEMMITDPMQWLQDYKVNNAFRLPWQANDAGFNFSINDGSSAYSCQVWLMGDGTSDSYSNMIRNQVQPSDQNYTKLNLISMVSNDIETVSIPGLS